jgi:hypothetical protein
VHRAEAERLGHEQRAVDQMLTRREHLDLHQIAR